MVQPTIQPCTMALPMTVPMLVVQPLIVPPKTALPMQLLFPSRPSPSQHSNVKELSQRDVPFLEGQKNFRCVFVCSFHLLHFHNFKKRLTNLFLSFCHGLISFLTALLLLTLYVVSKTYAFTLRFVLSHFSVLCKEGGGQITQQTISQFFCT